MKYASRRGPSVGQSVTIHCRRCGTDALRRSRCARYCLDCSLARRDETLATYARNRAARPEAREADRLRAKARRLAATAEQREALLREWGCA